jgi:hypothetical protein
VDDLAVRSSLAVLDAAVRDRMDDFIDQVVRRIATAIPSLGRDSTVDLQELGAAVECIFTTSLTMLTEQREASENEHAAWRKLSRRSAQLGVPIEDVVQALRICSATLWESLSQVAIRRGGTHAYDVLQQAPRLWLNFDHMASTVTEAHQEVGSSREIERSQRVCAFVSTLRRPAPDPTLAEALARALGFDPNGWFVALVHGKHGGRVDEDANRAVVAEMSDRVVVLLQVPVSSPEGEEQAAWLVEDLGVERAGIGVQRLGLEGAQQSLQDAEAAYRASVLLHAPVVKFRARWLSCLAVANREQHETLVADAVRYLRTDTQMRQTVAAYLQAEGSLPGAAALLSLHANTVAYRLRQLAERTELDARSAHGAALARLALTFAQMEVAEWDASEEEEALGQAAS